MPSCWSPEKTPAVLDKALDVLDDASAVPAQARGDVLRFVKDACAAQLFEVSIAELTVDDISAPQVKNVMLNELHAYCNALGA